MKELEQICRELGDDAVATLAQVMRSPDSSPAERIRAAEALLDRGYGRPVDRVALAQVSGRGEGEGQSLTTAQLMRIAAGGLPSPGGKPSRIIDLRPVPKGEDPPIDF